ncbi:MAG: 50S ribosomal protein L13 [Patescibacteria group bacterium]
MKSNNKKNPAGGKLAKYEIDATGKPYGRLATSVVTLIRGKHLASYEPNQLQNIQVTIINLEKARISDKKLDSTVFFHSSGYPGGLKKTSWRELYQKNPRQLFLKVLDNMLPTNRHKRQLLKQIKFQ